MADDINGWAEWSRHILAELVRLASNQEKLTERIVEFKDEVDIRINAALTDIRLDLDSIKGKVANIEPTRVFQLQIDVEHLKSSKADQEARLRSLETSQSSFSGKWAVIAGVGGAALAGFITFLVSLIKG